MLPSLFRLAKSLVQIGLISHLKFCHVFCNHLCIKFFDSSSRRDTCFFFHSSLRKVLIEPLQSKCERF